MAHDLFWALLGIGILIPVAVVWRSLQEFVGSISSSRATGTNGRAHPFLHVSMQIVMAILLFGWLWVLAPVQKETFWFFGSALIVGIPLAVIFRKRFERLQERIGSGLRQPILSREKRPKRTHLAHL